MAALGFTVDYIEKTLMIAEMPDLKIIDISCRG